MLILGVGNILLGDEGVGVHVARRLLQENLPALVEVVDGGTAGLDLVSYFRNRDCVIIVDALEADDEPGAIYRFTPEQLSARTREVMSLHQVGVVELIENARLLGFHSEITLFGVVPKDSRSCSLELTPEVERAVPRVIQMILQEIA